MLQNNFEEFENLEKIIPQKHSKETFIYSASRMFERASYYGVRTLIVFYMISETINMPNEKAFGIYGLVASCLLFSQLVGALFGDLLLGNKRALIIGGITQAIGTFVFCIPAEWGVYLGLVLMVLGGGFYSPNVISHFGKLYMNKIKLLDSAFNIFILAVNLGAFFGVMLIGYIGETHGYAYGFGIGGVLMLVSVTLPIMAEDNEIIVNNKPYSISIGKRIVKAIVAIIFVAFFWILYEFSSIRIFDLQRILKELPSFDIDSEIWLSLNSIFIIPLGLLAVIVWSYYYNSQFMKLMIGFLVAALSFWIILQIPETPDKQDIYIYLLSMLLIGASEVLIAPIVYSILTQYTNPKYLAIVISLAFIPTKLLNILVGTFNEQIYEDSFFSLKIALMLTLILGLILLVILLMSKRMKQIKNN